jgi:molybdopterin-binding protein
VFGDTARSLQEMGLKVGDEVRAVVKSTEVGNEKP